MKSITMRHHVLQSDALLKNRAYQYTERERKQDVLRRTQSNLEHLLKIIFSSGFCGNKGELGVTGTTNYFLFRPAYVGFYLAYCVLYFKLLNKRRYPSLSLPIQDSDLLSCGPSVIKD
jgi:hypothetical protein